MKMLKATSRAVTNVATNGATILAALLLSLCAGLVMAQTPVMPLTNAPSALSNVAPNAAPPVALPELGRTLAQTFNESDIDLLTNLFRDALQGRPIDETKVAPLGRKIETLAGTLFQSLMGNGAVLMDYMGGELKRELRELKSAPQ